MKLSRRRCRQIGSEILRNRFPYLQQSRRLNESNYNTAADIEVNEIPNLLDITTENENASYEINSNDSDDDGTLPMVLKEFCLKWRLRTKCIRELLSIFHAFGHTHELPFKTSEGLLGTPLSKLFLKEVDPGHYYHIGLQTITKHLSSKIAVNENSTFKIAFHIDGISFANASNVQGWTILGKLIQKPQLKPFLVGVYVGPGTPKDFDLFLEDLAMDIVTGRTEGFVLNENIVIHYEHEYTICDAPGRSKVIFYYTFSLKYRK